MQILLTNDDGIDAPGLTALWESVGHSLGEGIAMTVVAPDRCRSECGHTATSGRPLLWREHRPGWFSVDGTPVDCVRVALASLIPQADLVISGVNAGANLGVDLLVSGTFAAAREAALEGRPALAVSHYRRPDVASSWQHVPGWLAETLREFAREAKRGRAMEEPLLWNVNLPALDPRSVSVPPTVRCAVDRRPFKRTAIQEPSSICFESDFHRRPRDSGSDVDHCFSGSITISEIDRLVV